MRGGLIRALGISLYATDKSVENLKGANFFMGCNVQRPIDPAYFANIPRVREMLKSLPEEVRVCSECGKEVEITESDYLSNPGDAAPFCHAAIVGCDTSLDRAIAAIEKLHNKG